MTITIQNLAAHQLLQRTSPAVATVELRGQAAHDFGLEVLDAAGGVVAQAAATAEAGRWTGEVTIPTGGPYRLLARGAVGDPVTLVEPVLVGDLWILAGQSNMQGCGWDYVVDPSPEVTLLDMARVWRPATEPLHELYLAADPVHYDFMDDATRAQALADLRVTGWKGAGLGLAFGRELHALTGVPVGLIATAHGGTSMAQWSPELRDNGGGSLYGSMVLSLEAAGGRVAGLAWYQGESDALEGASAAYAERLEALVAAVRRDAGDPSLPFYHVQLGRLVADYPAEIVDAWIQVRETQRVAAGSVVSGVATAVDLGLADPIHISGAGLARLGRRLARLATGTASTPTLGTVATDDPTGLRISVTFDGVHGSLQPAADPQGFSIRKPDGTPCTAIFATAVDPGNPSRVIISLARALEAGDQLWYGYGLDPYCNLVDDEDMAVCAFGPIPLA